MPQIARNPETGETAVFDGGEWRIAASVAKSKDGKTAYLVGNNWITGDEQPKPVETPAPAPAQKSAVRDAIPPFVRGNLDVAAGAVRGAASIGATFLRPFESREENVQRRQKIDDFMRDRGADTESLLYGTGKFGAEVAGTAGAGGVVANAASSIPRVAATAPNVLAAIRSGGMAAGSMTSRMTGGAISGAASQGMVDPNDIGGGAAIGSVLPVVSRASGLLYSGVRNVIDPWLPGGIKRAAGRTIEQAAGSDRSKIIRLLAQNNKIVPGSAPTAGEVAAPAGSTVFSGLQGIVEPLQSKGYYSIAKGNEAARLNAIRSVGGTADDLANATAFRDGNASVNYGGAGKQSIRPDADLLLLMEKPSMTGVIKRAQNLAAENGERFAAVNANGKISSLPVKSLHYVKMAMDDLIRNPERFGIGASEARAIGGTQRQFVDWLGRKSPLYNEARVRFAADSDLMNRMQIGQGLESALRAPLGAGERSNVFAQAVRDEAKTITKATGAPRFDTLKEAFKNAPKDAQTIRNVVDDLARLDTFEGLSKAGAPEARALVGEISPRLPSSGPLAQVYTVTKTILNRISGKIEGDTLKYLSEAMKTPAGALEVLRAAGIPEQKISYLLRTRPAVGAVGTNMVNRMLSVGDQQSHSTVNPSSPILDEILRQRQENRP